MGYSMEQNFKDAAFVMKVKVLSVNDTIQMGTSSKREIVTLRPPFKSGFAPNLDVLNIYKGDLSKKIISLNGTEYCSEKYDIGQEYVLFVYEGKDAYYTRICENNFFASDSYSMERLRSILDKH